MVWRQPTRYSGCVRHNDLQGIPFPRASQLPEPSEVRLRTVFLVAVIIVLFVDAFFYSGAYTQAAYAQLVAAGDYLVSLIRGAIDSVKPGSES